MNNPQMAKMADERRFFVACLKKLYERGCGGCFFKREVVGRRGEKEGEGEGGDQATLNY